MKQATLGKTPGNVSELRPDQGEDSTLHTRPAAPSAKPTYSPSPENPSSSPATKPFIRIPLLWIGDAESGAPQLGGDDTPVVISCNSGTGVSHLPISMRSVTQHAQTAG
ncbi:MAG: hypothetical protein WBG04_07160 [Haloferula sp.]